MSGWDDEDYEPPAAGAPAVVPKDKWEGEDSDDDNIKAAWDQESDDEKPKTEPTEEEKAARAVHKKKKKKLAEIIAAKEEARLLELEALAERRAELDQLNTPEAKAEAKLRLQKKEESDNLELAKEMMGLKVTTGIDAMQPDTKEQFVDLEKAIGDKLGSLAALENYPEFAENLVKRICLDLNVAALKRVKLQVESLHSAKLKDEKAAKSKKPVKGRTTVKMDLDKDLLSGGVGGYDDMDDFM